MRRTGIALFIAAGMMVPTGLAAQSDGVFDAEDCSNAWSDTRLTVSGAVLSFIESECTLSNPRAEASPSGAYRYDADCAGEGEEWRDEKVLMRGGRGELILMSGGFTTVYHLCAP